MDQDPGKPSGSGRKVRYVPKVPPPDRKPKARPPTSTSESKNEDTEAQSRKLMRQFNEANTRQRPKVEKKSLEPAASAQVTFGAGNSSSPSIKSFGASREVISARGTDLEIDDSTSDEMEIVVSSTSTARDGTGPLSSDASTEKIKEDYKEPWNYEKTYYPIFLPLRKPYSGDPEILDEEEFGEAARKMEYDENTINSVSDLGLLDESEKQKLLFLQLPKKLPLPIQPASTKGKDKAESSKASGSSDALKDSELSKMARGYMGKMLVYKSGAVKMKVGDTLFDVSPGSDRSFPENLVAINAKEKTCSDLGELDKVAVVTPDVDSLLKP